MFHRWCCHRYCCRASTGPINLIVDSQGEAKNDDNDDDDETLVVVESQQVIPNTDQVSVNANDTLTNEEAEQQGHLVAQILETQKEFEDTSLSGLSSSNSSPKIGINWKEGRQREHEIVTREVDRLRAAIQSLTRAANPLGKLIDFLQEDVDSMQTELETWRITNSQLAVQLNTEQRFTEKSIQPLQQQLEELENLIQEQLEEVSLAKAAILKNDERIHKLLAG